MSGPHIRFASAVLRIVLAVGLFGRPLSMSGAPQGCATMADHARQPGAVARGSAVPHHDGGGARGRTDGPETDHDSHRGGHRCCDFCPGCCGTAAPHACVEPVPPLCSAQASRQPTRAGTAVGRTSFRNLQPPALAPPIHL